MRKQRFGPPSGHPLIDTAIPGSWSPQMKSLCTTTHKPLCEHMPSFLRVSWAELRPPGLVSKPPPPPRLCLEIGLDRGDYGQVKATRVGLRARGRGVRRRGGGDTRGLSGRRTETRPRGDTAGGARERGLPGHRPAPRLLGLRRPASSTVRTQTPAVSAPQSAGRCQSSPGRLRARVDPRTARSGPRPGWGV